MGHEISAKVIEVGPAVKEVKPGDYVVVEVTGTCMDKDRFPNSPRRNEPKCDACLIGQYNACKFLALTGLGFQHGGLAEYMVTPERKLIKYDETIIPPDVAAIIQPIAVSWHATQVGHVEPGHSVLITGGGPIGLTTMFALKGHRAGKIVVSEPAANRRKLAASFGAEVFDPTGKSLEECIVELKKMSPKGVGFDRAFDCSGLPVTLRTGVGSLSVRGVFTNVAIWAKNHVEAKPMDITLSEKYVTGSICFVKSDFEQCVRAFEKGPKTFD
ncbi:unnamed protein product [Ambrosiozyma monospora]|uniref:Unnamed protein product n=1 Tax=Ambrosiozyma monospora TaxID=43982 RepID=A0A9W6T0U0_AMBMO|nr:unnamed protein product [Ambrosiozyma monospora]